MEAPSLYLSIGSGSWTVIYNGGPLMASKAGEDGLVLARSVYGKAYRDVYRTKEPDDNAGPPVWTQEGTFVSLSDYLSTHRSA